MKTKMSYQNKKIAIIVAIVLVLIGGISLGAYLYFKGNTDAEATSDVNSTINNETIEEQNNVSEEQTNETSEETNTTVPSTNNETNSSENNVANSNSNNTSNNANGTNSNASNNANSNESNSEELPNEEYIQTDYIETGKQILVSESLKVGWMNASLIRDNVSTKIDVVKPTLELNKTAEINSVNSEDNSVQKGSKITYNITVTNTSKEADATNITITDKVPAGTILDEITTISDEGKEENGKITWNVNVPANSSKTVSFTVIVTAEEGEIKNTAIVDGKETPETENPVIESNKTYSSEDDIIRNGSIISYTITVTNKSNINAITSVRDTVPEGTTLEKVITYGSSVNENVITWNNVTLKVGETKTFTFDVKVNDFDGENRVIRNVAVVGDKETPETETEVHYPVINSTKTTDKGSVEAGDKLTYTITLTNSGIVDGNVKVIDSSPDGTMFDQSAGVTVSNDEKTYSEEELNKGIDVTVPANGEVTVSFTVTVNEGVTGSIKNTAIINDGTPTEEENPSVETPVITTEKTATIKNPDGTEKQNANNKVKAGDIIEYTIVATNTGDAEGTAIVADTIPSGTSFVAGSIEVNGNALTENNTQSVLEGGIEVPVTAKVNGTNGTGTLSFEVTVTGEGLSDENPISNTAYVNGQPTNETTTTYQKPVINVVKTANKTVVVENDTITYTITATNSGSVAGTVIVSDELSEKVTLQGDITVNDANPNNAETVDEDALEGGIELTVPAKANGTNGTATIVFTVKVNEGATGTISNTAYVKENEEDEGEPTTPVVNPIITAEKSATIKNPDGTEKLNANNQVKAGDIIEYTITLTNTEEVEGLAIVTDRIPTGTSFVEGSIEVNGNVLTENNTQSALEGGIEVPVTAKVNGTNGTGTLSFEVTVTGEGLSDENPISNTAYVNGQPTNETTTTYQKPVINVVKTANKTVVVENDTITYTITATNSGSVAGTVIVSDELSEKVTLQGDITVNDANPNNAETVDEDALEGGIELTVPAKANGTNGTATIVFTVKVNDGATGTISNTAYVKENEEDEGEPTEPVVNPIITAEKSAIIKNPDGTEKQNANNQVKVGDIITYTITLTNTSTDNANGTAIVKDTIPTGTSFIDESIKINGTEKPELDKDDIEGNNEQGGIKVTFTQAQPVVQTVSFDVRVVSGTTIENTAQVNETNTNTITTTVVADYRVEHYYNNVIENDVTDKYYNIPIGEVVEQADITLKEKDDYKFVRFENVPLTITSGENVIKVYYETPVITATKTNNSEGKELQEGDEVIYTITVENSGNVSGDAVVTDAIPEGLTYVSYEQTPVVEGDIITQPSPENNTLTWNVKNLAANEERTITITATVNAVEGEKTITNSVEVDGETTDTSTITVVKPTLEISKTASTILDTDDNGVEIPGQSKDEAEIGDTIVYTITVKNTSNVATTVNVNDPLANEVTFKEFTNNSANATYTNGVVSYNGTLAGGDTLTIQFTVTVNELASNKIGKEISNTANVNGKTTTANTKIVKKVTLTTTSQTMNSLDLVLVLDVSTSMSNSGEIANLKTAAKNLANRVFSSETNSTITMITYAGYLRSSETYNYYHKDNIINAIDKLGTYSGTNVYSALKETNSVVDKLLKNENAENRKRVVVFMTDGAPTFYTGGDNSALARFITAPSNSANDYYYANNLRPEIIEQAETLKKKDVDVYAVGLGIDNLLANKYQYAEKENSSIDQSMFKEDEATYIREGRKDIKVYRMTQKDYAKYLLNNISTSNKYIETSNLNETFDDILSKQTTNKYSYKATDEKLTITIPETRTIIADQDGKAVSVQIGNNEPVKYTLRQLSNGVNGLKYEEGKGFVWEVDTNILASDLYISYKVEGVAEDNQ